MSVLRMEAPKPPQVLSGTVRARRDAEVLQTQILATSCSHLSSSHDGCVRLTVALSGGPCGFAVVMGRRDTNSQTLPTRPALSADRQALLDVRTTHPETYMTEESEADSVKIVASIQDDISHTCYGTSMGYHVKTHMHKDENDRTDIKLF